MFLVGGNESHSWINASSIPFSFLFHRSSVLNIAQIHLFKDKTLGLSQIKGLSSSLDNEIPTDKRELWDKHVCLIPRLYSALQREQWKRARDELSVYDTDNVMKSYTPPRTGDEGRFHLEFYVHPYYLFSMTLSPNLRSTSRIDRNPTIKRVNYFTIYKVLSIISHCG